MLKKIGSAIRFKQMFGLLALFIIALFFSVIYHLPVSWLLAQPSVQKQIPEHVTLSPTNGTLWQGNTHLSTPQPIGKITWDLSFWALLIGQASVETVWKKEQSHLHSHINLPLFSETGEVNVSNLNGQVALPLIIQLLNAPGLNGLSIEGTMTLDEVNLSVDQKTQWPSLLNGLLIVNNLNVLGNAFPSITITPTLEGDKLTLNLSGGERGWTLSGQLEVFKNRQYNIALKVTAQSQENMPDWAGLLRQQSPTVAVLNNRGIW